MQKLSSFDEFWPVYLRAHANPACRALHYAASASGLAALALLLLTGSAWWLLAWIGHYRIENNVPLTFTHPWWSLVADYRMFFLWLTGGLPRHLRAANVEPA
jgi:hypothetical protein